MRAKSKYDGSLPVGCKEGSSQSEERIWRLKGKCKVGYMRTLLEMPAVLALFSCGKVLNSE